MPSSLYESTVCQLLDSNPPVFKSFPSPADWRDQWIYFLLIDRFNNPAKQPENGEPCGMYQGGNFAGIREQLPYLKKMGMGAIWLSPVLMNPLWFKQYWGGYGIMDFLRIEPRFCLNPKEAIDNPQIADKEFRDLVDYAHSLGIYVILDIVLNHVSDLFHYEGMRDAAPWNEDREYKIYWRDSHGIARNTWTDCDKIPSLPRDAGIWPKEFQKNEYFRRRGEYTKEEPTKGDFGSLKELATDYHQPGSKVYPVRNLLIRTYQYLMAKFDIDGYRIDTLQYVESDFARVFGNAIREYALSIGKHNFFTFGEIWLDDNDHKTTERQIAEFIGRNTEKDYDLIGIDAALDFPMSQHLVNACKGYEEPYHLALHFDARREVLSRLVSSHGDAGRYYVTFLDNHDMNARFHNPKFPEQTKIALTCLMTMQGIPCIYYGTEQGLDGHGNIREYVREALWGKENAFSQEHDLYLLLQKLSHLRLQQPALRYGRQYFRPCSGNGKDFAYSPYRGGIIAFSRILNTQEVLVVANTHTSQKIRTHIVIDKNLNPEGKAWNILFSTNPDCIKPMKVRNQGDCHTVEVTLLPMEAQVLSPGL